MEELHEGHRQRIYEKLCSGEQLEEHELLEILLFNAYPRKNTNPVAHSLITTFGSLRGVLEADYEKVCAVPGVGPAAAKYLHCLGRVTSEAYTDVAIDIYLKNYGDFKKYASRRLRNRTTEVVELYLLERSGRVKYVYSHSDIYERSVFLKMDEVAALLASEKPFGAVLAHNHPKSTSLPSSDDDRATAAMLRLCGIAGVKFFDHIIYSSDNDTFSYFTEDRLDALVKALGGE